MAGEDALEPSRRFVIPAQFNDGESLSDKVDMTNFVLTGVIVPASWTAASISFQAAAPNARDKDHADYFVLVDSLNAEVTLTVAANRFVALTAVHAEMLKAVNYLRLQSGTSAAPVNQTGAKTLYLVGAVKF